MPRQIAQIVLFCFQKRRREMPLVVVTRGPEITDERIKPLLDHLRQIVAEELTVPGTDGELNANEIEVRVQETRSLDQNVPHIAITIWANEYPKRLANLDERRRRIAQRVRDLIPDVDGNLWILLQPGSFEEWKAKTSSN
ncbi:MAG: hypothetical protein A3C82_01660 [Candidatus Wildermuthbacteria bacterium RIFCSPHIGHO2_02_FULL_47_12]|uniref:Uncharacterized protein n=1 Tax=Candidatus Wildermuthbacteria bacterium RIFCSPHIGHO2_02_FULL_47_12 TaxID=1802451 RepID=A0A1G2R392_9BACT|nr:MAG: hypothetical protein A3C82_01660 [Candidatus Wildermuthbacteria bacterium RIFCSPHIGHO2_02_FULL_47_12]